MFTSSIKTRKCNLCDFDRGMLVDVILTGWSISETADLLGFLAFSAGGKTLSGSGRKHFFDERGHRTMS